MTTETLTHLISRIEQLSAHNQKLADTVACLRADRELLKRWNDDNAATGAAAKRS
jgi:hypothetical protein